MSTPTTTGTYVCRYCRQVSDPTQASCIRCGAPVDVRASVSDSGWQAQPPIKDMARIQFGQSRLQIEGTLVPVADFALAPSEWVYFSHHSLLWADQSAQLAAMPMKGGLKRRMAGLPLVMMQGSGPGHLALSDNHAGELIALPLQNGQSIWVREHRFVAASGNISYDWQSTHIWFRTGTGDDTETHYPLGQFGDTFTAHQTPGLLLVHSPGNTFVRDLRAGETLLIQPTSLIYRDITVRMQLHFEYPRGNRGSFWNSKYNNRTVWLRLFGPGRVAVQSKFEKPETSERITGSSRATVHKW
jgi:uncharacterized protein (AIM24 family)